MPAAPRRQAKLSDGPNGIVAGGNGLRSELGSRLRSERLAPEQRRLAQCLIERRGEIDHLSGTELAEFAKVSQPSVMRFATAVGFDGFFDMRRQLRNDARPPAAATGVRCQPRGGWGGEITEMARQDVVRTHD